MRSFLCIMQLMNVASFVIDRTSLFEWFTKCNILIYRLLLFSPNRQWSKQSIHRVFCYLRLGLGWIYRWWTVWTFRWDKEWDRSSWLLAITRNVVDCLAVWEVLPCGRWGHTAQLVPLLQIPAGILYGNATHLAACHEKFSVALPSHRASLQGSRTFKHALET